MQSSLLACQCVVNCGNYERNWPTHIVAVQPHLDELTPVTVLTGEQFEIHDVVRSYFGDFSKCDRIWLP